jgi:hypothetical protein
MSRAQKTSHISFFKLGQISLCSPLLIPSLARALLAWHSLLLSFGLIMSRTHTHSNQFFSAWMVRRNFLAASANAVQTCSSPMHERCESLSYSVSPHSSPTSAHVCCAGLECECVAKPTSINKRGRTCFSPQAQDVVFCSIAHFLTCSKPDGSWVTQGIRGSTSKEAKEVLEVGTEAAGFLGGGKSWRKCSPCATASSVGDCR